MVAADHYMFVFLSFLVKKQELLLNGLVNLFNLLQQKKEVVLQLE